MKEAATLIIAIALIAPAQPAMADDEIHLTFLGTGAPRPSKERYGPAILVEAGDYKILVDAGLRGEGNGAALAEVAAATCLCGEISIVAAIAAGDFSRAHETLARMR